MKSFKKFTALMLTVVMCLSMASCSVPGQGDNPASTPSGGNQDESKTDDGAKTDDSSKTDTQSPEATPGEKLLRLSFLADIPTLDQQKSNSMPSATVGIHLFEGLTRMRNGEILPGIAETWDISEDGKTYTFHLRDSKWSDGQPLVAGDFEYGIKRLMDPATASPYSFIGAILKNGDAVSSGKMAVDELGVKAIDDKTLEIVVEYPAGYFLGMVSMFNYAPCRKDMVEKYGADFAANGDKNVYNGPFMLKDWVHENKMTLVKNPNYWNAGETKLDTVEVYTIDNGNTALAMYEEGSLDLVQVPSAKYEGYKDDAILYYDGSNDFIKLNMAEGQLLANKNLRLALNYGLDREDFVNITTKGLYDANPRYVLPQVNGSDGGQYGDQYPYEAFPVKADLDKAKECIDKAVAELGFSSPSDITLEFLTTDSEGSRTQAEVVQDQLKRNLGINIEVRQVPYKQRLEMEDSREFEMVFTGWVPDYSDPMTYLELWTTDSAYNQISYNSADYDNYVHSARMESDPDKRMEMLFNAEKTLLEDGAIMPMQLRRVALLVNPKVKGLTTYFVGSTYDWTLADIAE